jgi:hypothetical protein
MKSSRYSSPPDLLVDIRGPVALLAGFVVLVLAVPAFLALDKVVFVERLPEDPRLGNRDSSVVETM